MQRPFIRPYLYACLYCSLVCYHNSEKHGRELIDYEAEYGEGAPYRGFL